VTDQEINRHRALRQKRAAEILATVDQFKVCDQCRSISYKRAQTCTVCGAYRFNDKPALVSKTAREMGANPFPTTSGTVPRLDPA
jgi:recombinational DNA repair protein RecR